MSERDLRLFGHFGGLFSNPTREEIITMLLDRVGDGNPIMGVRLPGKGGRTTYQEISRLRMVAGNENKFCDVIHNGRHMHWVGIGWVTQGVATNEDYSKYPVIAGSADGNLADILKLKAS